MGQAEFYAEAWALVHLLLQGERDDKALYTSYFNALVAGQASRAAADQFFPEADAARLLERLKAHVKALRREIEDEAKEEKGPSERDVQPTSAGAPSRLIAMCRPTTGT
jgi:hypothetical protein